MSETRAATHGIKAPSSMLGWMELFSDLVFVATTLIFSSAMVDTPVGAGKYWIYMAFAMVWWIWMSSTMFFNRFRLGDVPLRIILLIQMFLLVLFAMEAKAGIDNDITVMTFEFGGLLATVALMYLFGSLKERGSERRFAQQMAGVNFLGALLFIVAAPFPDVARYPIGALGLLIVIVPTILPNVLSSHAPLFEEAHLVERLGAFSLIMMGETFVEIALAISGKHITIRDSLTLALEFLLAFSLWGAYFEDIPHAGLQQSRVKFWVPFHLILQLSIVTVGVGVSTLVNLPLGEHLPDADAVEIISMMATFYLALGGLAWCSRRRPLKKLVLFRLGTAVVMLGVTVLAWTDPAFHVDDIIIIVIVLAIAELVAAPFILKTTTVSQAPQQESVSVS